MTDTTAGEGVFSLPSRDGDVTSIAQVAQCIIMNVEERDGWADDGGLVTIRCHAEVIRDDALALAAQPSAGAQPVARWECRTYGIDGQPGAWELSDGPADGKTLRPCRIIEYRPLYTHPHPSLSVGLDKQVRERLQAAVDDADAGGRYDHCKDDGSRVEIDTEDLRSLFALAAPAEGWQPIETAPEDGPEFLVCTERRNIYTVFRRSDEGPRFMHFGGGIAREVHETVTGWLPITCLPAAPTGETGK